MRRGKAALAILRGVRLTLTRDRILHFTREGLRRLVLRHDLAASAESVQLGIEANDGKSVDLSLPSPVVTDALDRLAALGTRIRARRRQNLPESGEDFPQVMRAYMIAPVRMVGSVPLKMTVDAQIASPSLIGIPDVHAASVLAPFSDRKVRSVAVLPGAVGVTDASLRVRISEPPVRERTAGIASFPHIRRGVDIEKVAPEEQEGFLQEAESTKGIPVSQGQLLALFRNVPVELIAKAHYSEEKRLLLYTVDGGRSCTRTRLHDLGIVRDAAGGKTHMVVHRRQFKQVTIA